MSESWDIPGALDGERVDRALALITGLSRTTVNQLLERGQVSIGGRPLAVRSRKVHEGERLSVTGDVSPHVTPPPAPDPAVDVPVVWHDELVIVVDKPAGLVVHSGAGNATGTLVNGLLARFPDLAELGGDRPGIVHRLDKGTSGLLVVARTVAAYTSLSGQLTERRIERQYLALVAGTVESDSGLIDAPISRSDADPTKMGVQLGGREARTRYQVEARFEEATLLRCRLETGRTHQIRVHLASIGHPVIGDDRYGGASTPGLQRPFLHATVLAFDHPDSSERVSFESPLPADLMSVLG